MKRTVLFAMGLLALSAGTFAQAPDAAIEKALAAAPRNLKEGAAVIKFKADGTYDTLKPGTNRLSATTVRGSPDSSRLPCSATSVANIPRVVQNMKFEAMPDKAARQAALEAAEKDGTPRQAGIRLGLVHDERPDKAHATRVHVTIAVPGRDHPVDRPAERQQAGRRLDHERGHVDRTSDDARQLGIKK